MRWMALCRRLPRTRPASRQRPAQERPRIQRHAALLDCKWPLHARQGSQLDGEAAARGTTVYLTDRRLDMLPALLSEQLCRRGRSLLSEFLRSLFRCSRAGARLDVGPSRSHPGALPGSKANAEAPDTSQACDWCVPTWHCREAASSMHWCRDAAACAPTRIAWRSASSGPWTLTCIPAPHGSGALSSGAPGRLAHTVRSARLSLHCWPLSGRQIGALSVNARA